MAFQVKPHRFAAFQAMEADRISGIDEAVSTFTLPGMMGSVKRYILPVLILFRLLLMLALILSAAGERKSMFFLSLYVLCGNGYISLYNY